MSRLNGRLFKTNHVVTDSDFRTFFVNCRRRFVWIVLLLASTEIFVPTTSAEKTVHKPPYCQRRHYAGVPSTFLWRVKRQPPAYFFGTIHVPYTEVWDYVSDYAKDAFRKSDTVFLELDLTNPSTLGQLNKCQLLPGNESLRDHIPSDMFDRLNRLMERVKAALPSWLEESDGGWTHSSAYINYMFDSITGNWQRKRPVWVMTMLDSLSLDTFRHHGEPTLDLYLAQQADSMSKPFGAIERVHEQCDPLNALDKRHAFMALNRTLTRQEMFADKKIADKNFLKMRTTARDLIENYNCGSLNETIFARNAAHTESSTNDDAVNSEDKFDIDAYFRRELIDKRNERIAKRALHLMDSEREKSFFFAFGAAHFLGAGSVVELVKAAGYDVEAVPMTGWYGKDDSSTRRTGNQENSKSDKRPKRPRRPKLPQNGRGRNHQTWTLGEDTLPSASSLNGRRRFDSTSTPRQRVFQELWVRKDGYTSRPFLADQMNAFRMQQEESNRRVSSVINMNTPQNVVVVQFHHYHAAADRVNLKFTAKVILMNFSFLIMARLYTFFPFVFH